MERSRFSISALTIVLSIFLLFAISSCSDPCKDVACQNGTCVEGTCECEAGWTGTDCGTAIVVADPCANVNCNNGTCANGTCVCDTGYEGTNCSTPVNMKFDGNYAVIQTCSPVDTTPHFIVIVADSIDHFKLMVTGIHDEQPPMAVAATVSGTNLVHFDIPRTAYGFWDVSGNGDINVSTGNIDLRFNLLVSGTGNLVHNCSADLIRQ